jgi:hypothetical protein
MTRSTIAKTCQHFGSYPGAVKAPMSEAGETIALVFWTPFPDPLPVELIDHTNWSQLWLPFITAMIGSAVALFGVFWSNRTNRRAIDSADERARDDRQDARDLEFRKWQRDTLLRLSDEVVAAGLEAHDEYLKLIHLHHALTGDNAKEYFETIDAQSRRIAENIARMRLIGAHETAQRAVALRVAINSRDLVQAVIDVATAGRNRVAFQLKGLEREQFETETAEAQKVRDQGLDNITTTRAAFGQAVERELARTNAPPTPTSAPVKRRRWYLLWLVRR